MDHVDPPISRSGDEPANGEATGEEREHYLKRELYALVRSDPSIFEFLQAGSLDGIWYWDLEQPDHEWMSPQFWETLGFDPATKEHLASEWQDIIQPDDLKVALENFERHCEDHCHPYDQVVRYRRESGGTTWVRCRGIAIRDDEGKPIRMLGAHTDISRLKRAESELAAANRELEAFCYSVSHDLRAPLRAIEGFSRMLVEGHSAALGGEGKRLLGVVIDETQRMSRLIDDLLTFSRAGRASLKRKEVDLGALCRRVAEELLAGEQRQGVDLEIGPLPVVLGDRSLLQQVLVNLLDNAIKFSRHSRPPTIRVFATEEDGAVAVTVEDNGAGFEPAYADKLFGVFERLHSQEEFEGTGIGLALANRIIARHGGTITAESVVGEGATFTFTMPSGESS